MSDPLCLPAESHSPRIEFPADLPVSAQREAIAAALEAHPVVIVCGETGSGKTTQLPKIAWACGRGRQGLIGLTQPRRIAARSVAERLAQETATRLGDFIGWQVRFSDHVGAGSRIKVMTDGILLAETQSDPEFRAYDTIILDEAHERSLNIDFLLGYLKNLLPRRPDLKLVLSSATLEAERFAAWFGGAPIVQVSGRTYPVEVRYRPLAGTASPPPQPSPLDGEGAKRTARPGMAEESEPDLIAGIVAAVDELAAEGPGDILVFLPGEREIREAQEALRKHHPPQTELLPLYARLSVAEQARVFQPHSGRRIVLATNVAETSLTVPGIRYVVDTGLARVKRYSLRHKIEQLKIEPISQAAANQRAGRCGRVAAGIAIRLYDEQDFAARPTHTTPELLRASLAGVILRMKALGLPDIETFPFPDPPEPKRVRDGLNQLVELGALDAEGRLTPIGRALARLPVDPRIGRMLIAARERGCLAEVLVIAAFLSVQDPRLRPLDQQAAADEKHRRFADPNSDFIALLRLWQYINELDAHRKSARKFRAALEADFLSPLRVREWRDVHTQLATLVKEMGWKVGDLTPLDDAPATDQEQAGAAGSKTAAGRYARLHQALLAGLLGSIGMLTEAGDYLGPRGMRFALHPANGLRSKPKWVMAAEIVETRRIYARLVARVEPAWIEQAGRHLLKLSYGDPHWEKRPAHVAATLRATLHGLPVVAGRKVHYGPIDPVLSRELFIRHALVEGEWDCRAPFFRHNRQLIEAARELAERVRDLRLEPDPQALYAHFDAIVPAGIHNGADFERWRRQAEATNPRLLFLDRERLLANQVRTQADYPTEIRLGEVRCPLAYRFEPGAADDGVTLLLPVAALNQIPATACDWLVPGLLAEKIAALLKGLPQSLRRNFVPVAHYAQAAAEALAPLAEAHTPPSLIDSLAAFLERTTGVAVPRTAWRPEALPPHLSLNIRVLDANGGVLGEGRDLAALRAKLTEAARQAVQASAAGWERGPIAAWDFGDLPRQVSIAAGRRELPAYPALAIQTDGTVHLRLLESFAAARAAHRLGVCRLLWLSQRERLKQSERDLAARLKAACLHWGLLRAGETCAGLIRDLLAAACLSALAPRDAADIRTAADFATTAQTLGPRLAGAIDRLAELTATCLDQANALREALARAPAAWRDAVADMQGQLDALLAPGFLVHTPPARVGRLPAYLKAMRLRLEKLARHPARDAQAMAALAPLLADWRAAHARRPDDPDLQDFRWQLEELRIALFAQEVRTPEPVSVKRLTRRWAEIRAAA
ncbi:MAG: ATP-dependent RNA helicase HrpA [Thiobacillaceae bacterium]